ncbi:MAG: M14 family zinc carboxypeptidase [Flavobacteriales bacterium]
MIQPSFLRCCKPVFRVALMLLFATNGMAQSTVRYSKVKVRTDTPAHSLQRLGALGLAVDHGEVVKDHWIITDLSTAELERARAHGFTCEVLIDDVVAHYREQNRSGEPSGTKALGWLCDGPRTFTVPQHFELGSMGGYYTWTEMLAILDSMTAAYPNLISPKVSIGTSIEGRDIHFVRLSNNPNVDQAKPEVMFNALHHAREPAGLTQLVFFMWYLLENYGTDPEATYLLDNREIYIVPCVNPDGYVYNETTDPSGGGMWRKNRRDNGDGTFGVDLNRNYGWLWGADDNGSSPDPASEVYRGTGPFSEPETQALRDFCIAHEFRSALNYHTYGNMLIHPWGYGSGVLTVDSMLFTAHADLLTRNNGYVYGTCDQALNYNVNGTSDDWMYGEQVAKDKIISMTPESGLGDEGFWPPDWRILPICQETMDEDLLQTHLVGAYAQVTDRSPAVIAGLAQQFRFDLQGLGLETAGFSVSVEPLLNVLSTSGPVAFSNVAPLDVLTDSIEIFLDPAISDGDEVRFVVLVDNGLFATRDTISKVYGQPTIALTNAGNTMMGWAPNSWGITTEHSYSPPTSITDSPFSTVADFDNILDLAAPIDLSLATSATLTFMARWDIKHNRDYAQVQASPDEVNWTSLCGIHTRPGSVFQDPGQPIIDGDQQTWVREEMSLDAFVGADTYLRFRMFDVNAFNNDGFYMDDLEVVITGSMPSGIAASAVIGPLLRIQPNPASGQFGVQYTLSPGSVHPRLIMRDAVGAVVRQVPISASSGSLTVDLSGLSPGVYVCIMAGDGFEPIQQRLVVVRP